MPSTPLTAPARKKIRAAAKKSGTGCGTRCDALLLRGAPTKPRFFVTGPCASDQTNLQFLVLACERATLTAASAELHMTLAAVAAHLRQMQGRAGGSLARSRCTQGFAGSKARSLIRLPIARRFGGSRPDRPQADTLSARLAVQRQKVRPGSAAAKATATGAGARRGAGALQQRARRHPDRSADAVRVSRGSI